MPREAEVDRWDDETAWGEDDKTPDEQVAEEAFLESSEDYANIEAGRY